MSSYKKNHSVQVDDLIALISKFKKNEFDEIENIRCSVHKKHQE